MSTTIKPLDVARFIVEKTCHNLFLTGKAGTGKTTFLRDINKHTEKKHIVLAPTGVAAVNAGAMTIHSFFQFGLGPYVKGVSVPEGFHMIRKEKLELIRSLELIIIDEISMVRADLLDHVNDELQRIRRNTKPFGGVQMVMIGDLQQLPPVTTGAESEILNSHYDSMYFFDSKALRSSDYYCIELQKVYRQTDQHFIDILNRARTGELTYSDINELNSHYDPGFTQQNGYNYIQLVTHNRMADAINKHHMEALSKGAHTYHALTSGTFPEDSFPTAQKLELKVGAQVMFIKNDPEGEYVNGSLGVIKSLSEDSIIVSLSSRNINVEVEKVVWENIRYHYNEETKMVEAKKIGSFTQYPLKPAWAITIHKSQGLTFERAIIDAHASFSPGQAYVALSRCRSLNGLVLSNRLTKSVFITDSIVEEYMKGAVQDIDTLAKNVGYEYFDYTRAEQPADDGVINELLVQKLKEWRLKKSREDKVPAYVILHDRTIEALASGCPANKNALLQVNGIGPTKVELYGEELLGIIYEFKDKYANPVVTEPRGERGKSGRTGGRNENQQKTWEISFEMFRRGMSVQEIARERSNVESTILGHLARYVKSGELDVHRFISEDTIRKVARYKNNFPEDNSLKGIFEHYDGKISYEDIKMAIAHLARIESHGV